MQHNYRSITFGRGVWDIGPIREFHVGPSRNVQGLASHDDGLVHPSVLVLVRLLKLGVRLHHDKRLASWVFHNSDVVPDGVVAEELLIDVSYEDDLSSHRR